MRKGIIYVYFNRAKYEKEGIEKYYVGQTIGTMEQRAGKDGIRYGWADLNCNSKFARSIRKWGWDAFEGRVLEEVYEEDLNELEKFYIEQFDSYENGYNSTIGGEGVRGFNAFANKTEEEMKEIKKNISIAVKKRYEDPKEREKISAANIKRYEDAKEREKTSIAIKKHYEEPKEREKLSKIQRKRFEDEKEREKLSKAQRKRFEDEKEREKLSLAGKKHYEDEKEREKMSVISKKRYKDPKEREKQSIAIKKRFQDPKEREKQSKAQRKRFEDEKEREKIREKLSGEKSYKAKSVYCKELNIVFSYVVLAEKYCINVLNSKIGPISYVCNGKRKSTGKLTDGTKLTWSWLENVDKEILDKAEFIDSKKYEEILSQNVNDCK